MDRRYFLSSAAAAGVALRSRALASANDTVRVACVGFRGRGKDHIRAYSQMPNVEIAALCDIDEALLNLQVAAVEKAKGKRPAAALRLAMISLNWPDRSPREIERLRGLFRRRFNF